MRALLASWRAAWGQPEAPWFYVQVAPYRSSGITACGKSLTPEELPVFWVAQSRALALPHTGLVVTTDLAGDRRNIHPTNERDVGIRLARLASSETCRRGTMLARSPALEALRLVAARVPVPVAVRFAWHELAEPNLTNSAGLPAVPFRTDDWPVVRERPKPAAPARP